MKIGDLFLALGVDSADFKAVVTKEAEAAGKVGASKFSSTFATGLKVGSVIVGAAFGLMAKGAIEMEKSQGKFQAATGRSREEAIEFSKAMNGIVGSAKTVGASFEEISDTGIAVSQQFDITGQKATDLTEDILGFAKVTGQDASDAALQLEDTLSAFGLSADDASGFMDQLVASSQKFGTDAGPATLSILQGMAPALQAMGEDLDAGVGLLNLFETAGLDAAKAPAALNKAIATLKPGQSLDDLITQISSIEDPTLRAQEAMKIFGARSGVGLANAMQPGIDSLDDFIPTIEEAAGASDRAADDMLTTSDKIRMFTEKAGSYLRGLGQDFGPVVTGLASIASLGAPFAKGIVGLFKGLLTSAPIKAAAGAAGAAASAAYSAGMKVADAIGGALSAAWGGAQSLGKAVIEKAGLIAGGIYAAAIEVSHKIIHGLTSIWEHALAAPIIRDAIAKAGAFAGGVYAGGMKVVGAIAGVLEGIWIAIGKPGSAMLTAAGASGITAGSAFSSGVLIGLATLGVAAAAIFGQKFYDEVLKPGMGTNGPQAFDAALAQQMSAAATNAGTAAGTVLGETTLDTAVSTLEVYGPPAPPGWAERWGQETGTMTGEAWALSTLEAFKGGDWQAAADAAAASGRATAIAGQEAILNVFRNGDWSAAAAAAGEVVASLNRGLQDSLPSARSAWKDFVNGIGKELDPLEELAWLKGKLGGKKLRDGLSSENPFARQDAEDTRDIIVDEIAKLERLLGIEGQLGGDALGDGVVTKKNKDNAKDAAATLAQQARDGFAQQNWNQWGGSAYNQWENGFLGDISKLNGKIKAQIRVGVGALIFNSPAKEGPLRDLAKWGRRAALEWLNPFTATLGSGLNLQASALSLGGLGGFDAGALDRGRSVSVGDVTINVYGVDGDPEEIGSKAAAAFAWNLEHAMSAVTSG